MKMNRKLILIRAIVGLIIFIVIFLAVMLIRVCVINIKENESKSIFNEDMLKISTKSYINWGNNNKTILEKLLEEENNNKSDTKYDKKDNKQKKKENIDIKEENDSGIYKFVNMIKKTKWFITNNIDENDESGEKRYKEYNLLDDEVKTRLSKIQKIYNDMHIEKDRWVVIDEDYDDIGFNYYFDKYGVVMYDTLSPEYKVIDKYGRELDDDLKPIKYKIEISTMSEILLEDSKATASVIISPGVVFKNKLYDKSISREVVNYIDDSLRFKKTVNGEVYNGDKWFSCSSMKDDGGYVIFENPKNNFNKIIGKITTQRYYDSSINTSTTLYVYDADTPYLNERDDVESIYEISDFDKRDPVSFDFTFNRSIKRLKFFVVTDNEDFKPIIYFDKLRYGFSEEAYKNELEEMKDNEAYIERLKELGIYNEEIYEYYNERSNDIEDDYLEFLDWYEDDYDYYDDKDLSDYDEDYEYNDLKRDRVTGPYFDRELKEVIDKQKIGPSFMK